MHIRRGGFAENRWPRGANLEYIVFLIDRAAAHRFAMPDEKIEDSATGAGLRRIDDAIHVAKVWEFLLESERACPNAFSDFFELFERALQVGFRRSPIDGRPEPHAIQVEVELNPVVTLCNDTTAFNLLLRTCFSVCSCRTDSAN